MQVLDVGATALFQSLAGRRLVVVRFDDFEKVSTNDLRRRFAQRLLVDEQTNPCVVMAVGGCDSFATIEPYLNAPSEDVIDDEFDAIDL